MSTILKIKPLENLIGNIKPQACRSSNIDKKNPCCKSL